MSKRLILIIVFISMFAALVHAGDYCDICRQKIEGPSYNYTYDNVTRIICSDCVSDLGRCKLCGIPVKFTRKGDKDVICDRCRRSAKKCAICSSIITERYYVDETDHIFCEKCYHSADRCSICENLLIPGFWDYFRNKKVCNTCLRERPKCHACNNIIGKHYSQYIGFDGKFCPECVNNTPACISCLRPCGKNPFRLANGNPICRDCMVSAVRDKHQLEKVVIEVSRYLEQRLGIRIETTIDFKLVDYVDNQISYTEYRESGRFIRFGEEFTIKILAGLSRELCIETVAHELAHAWQAENCRYLPSDELVEGFAQWIAGKVLLGYGYSSLIPRLDHRDDVYGRGYKKLVKMEKDRGFDGVFAELIRLGNPPR